MLHSAEMMSVSEKFRDRSALGISNECDRVTIFKIVSPLPVLQSSCYSLFKRHRCKVSLSTITLRVEEGAVAGAALCQAHVGVIGIEEILTALVNIDHQLGGLVGVPSLRRRPKSLTSRFTTSNFLFI